MLLCAAGPVLAATSYVIANVDRVLIYGYNTFGGCMAALSVSPQSVLAGCQGSWVTFSCTGDFTDQVRAYRMVDVAELALATGKEVQVFFRDDMKHNGYCFAYRIDVLR
jgi:hypothetical protein